MNCTFIYFLHIEKFFKNKLILSFLAIILVIKLIKIKLFWILPLIVGVTAAKKLLLKFILFLFPALSHLFKLCSYYHKNYQDTKYHHHHHQINHLHTVCKMKLWLILWDCQQYEIGYSIFFCFHLKNTHRWYHRGTKISQIIHIIRIGPKLFFRHRQEATPLNTSIVYHHHINIIQAIGNILDPV